MAIPWLARHQSLWESTLTPNPASKHYCSEPPPLITPRPLAAFVWQPFNKKEFGLSFAHDDPSFADGSMPTLQALLPSALVLSLLLTGLLLLYYLHQQGSDTSILNSAAVLSPNSLCPLFDGSSTTNLFKCHFGFKFHDDVYSYVWPFLPFEFTSCFGDQLQYRISQHGNWFGFDAGIPSLTSAWVFDHILEWLVSIHDATMEIFEKNQFTAPAATIQAFLGVAVGTRLPSRQRWIQAYNTYNDLKRIRDILANPSTLSNNSLRDINYNYHSALRKLLIMMEVGFLVYQKPISGEGSYTHLQLVPKEFYNILFIAFHSNPVGGHLNAYRTLHHIRLRFYWPGMFRHAPAVL